MAMNRMKHRIKSDNKEQNVSEREHKKESERGKKIVIGYKVYGPSCHDSITNIQKSYCDIML